MSGRSLRGRLRFPASTPAATPETLLLRTPWFYRPDPFAAGEAPAIQTIVEDSFIDAFFNGLRSSVVDPTSPRPGSWASAAWKPLRAWRDWCEPPEGALDAAGQALYDLGQVKRREPLSGEVEAEEAPPGAPNPELMDPVERAEWTAAGGAPAAPWLRKLFLPTHRQFQVISAQVVCDRYREPPVDRRRVVASGVVLRRLVTRAPGAASGGPTWQDWLAGRDGRGAWITLGGEAARPTGGVGVDPLALPASAVGGEAVAVALRGALGLKAAEPLRLGSAPMSTLPMEHGKPTVVFGYLPVTSSEMQVPLADGRSPTQRWSDTVGAARASLDVALSPSAQASLHTQLMADLRSLAGVVLSAAASVLATDRTDILNFSDFGVGGVGGPPGDAGALLDAAILSARRRLINELLVQADPGHAHLATLTLAGLSARGAWRPAALITACNAEVAAHGGWLHEALEEHATQFRRLVDQALTTWLSSVDPPGWTDQPETDVDVRDWGRLVLACLVRTWVLRRELLLLWLGTALRTDERSSATVIAQDLAPRFADVDRAGNPLVTLRSLGEEIAAWEAAERNRGSTDPDAFPIPSWDVLTPRGGTDPQGHHQAHLLLAGIESRLSGLEVELGAFGPVWNEALQPRVGALFPSGALRGLAAFVPRAHGLEVSSDITRALLIFPTWQAQAPSTVLRTAAEGGPVPTAPADVAALMEADDRVTLPRYDAETLYVAQVWVRVAGRDPCEPERVVWSAPSEPFLIADPHDLLGIKPTSFPLPDLRKLVRDLPRIARAGAFPFAAVGIPPGSDVSTGEEIADVAREWGVAFICSFGIPVFTICAWIMFKIIFTILLLIPGFAWMLLLKFCIPVPVKKG